MPQLLVNSRQTFVILATFPPRHSRESGRRFSTDECLAIQ
jgi:hypothetical protein